MKNKKKLTLLVDSGFNKDYKKFLENRFELNIVTINDYTKNNKVYRDINLVLFTGGSDVTPKLYNENIGENTLINEKRDQQEENMFFKFDHIPKLGICRGSQFLTVMSGGKLIQHVSGHLGNHKIHLKPNIHEVYERGIKVKEYEITSTHHQMMFPFKLNKKNYRIIGWSKRFRSDTYLDGDNKEIELPTQFVEPEIVYYINSNSLCIQGHPEFYNCPSKTSDMILDLIDNLLLNKNKEKLIKNYKGW